MLKAGFTDGNGATARPPDEVQYRFGCRHGQLVEVFSDGNAVVRFYDDWEHVEDVNWCHLCKVPDEYVIGPPADEDNRPRSERGSFK